MNRGRGDCARRGRAEEKARRRAVRKAMINEARAARVARDVGACVFWVSLGLLLGDALPLSS